MNIYRLSKLYKIYKTSGNNNLGDTITPPCLVIIDHDVKDLVGKVHWNQAGYDQYGIRISTWQQIARSNFIILVELG
jgi:hypothetical protein